MQVYSLVAISDLLDFHINCCWLHYAGLRHSPSFRIRWSWTTSGCRYHRRSYYDILMARAGSWCCGDEGRAETTRHKTHLETNKKQLKPFHLTSPLFTGMFSFKVTRGHARISLNPSSRDSIEIRAIMCKVRNDMNNTHGWQPRRQRYEVHERQNRTQ